MGNFNCGEPNNIGEGHDCVEMLRTGYWNDGSCDHPRPFVCGPVKGPGGSPAGVVQVTIDPEFVVSYKEKPDTFYLFKWHSDWTEYDFGGFGGWDFTKAHRDL